MKVQIKDLKPNPYRDMENYPIDQDKLKSLKDSIEQTGFWDNILARKVNGKVQIAYGHHRLEALRQIKDSSDEVDIPVKELSDALMIKIMANENMEQWKTSPKIINETVRIVKQFLEQHPGEFEYHGTEQGFSKEVLKIAEFLGWKPFRIKFSLERLRLIEEDIIDKEAIEELPTERSARDFVKAVKDYDLPKSKQKSAVKRILETSRGKQAVEDAIIIETYRKPEKKKSEIEKERVKKFDTELAIIKNKAEDLISDLQNIKRLINELGQEPFKNSIQSTLLLFSLRDLKNQIDLLITKTEENEK